MYPDNVDFYDKLLSFLRSQAHYDSNIYGVYNFIISEIVLNLNRVKVKKLKNVSQAFRNIYV